MYLLTKKTPKEGYIIQMYIYKDESKETVSEIFMGCVSYSDRKSITLEGLYEDVTPLKACPVSGTFVPLRHTSINFPRPKIAANLQYWKKISTRPEKVGQYITFVNGSPIRISIINTADVMNNESSFKSTNLMCLIGGTHSVYATSFFDLQEKLKAEKVLVFPEYTDGIYNDMVSLLRSSVQSKVLHAFKDTTISTNQATELKLCV